MKEITDRIRNEFAEGNRFLVTLKPFEFKMGNETMNVKPGWLMGYSPELTANGDYVHARLVNRWNAGQHAHFPLEVLAAAVEEGQVVFTNRAGLSQYEKPSDPIANGELRRYYQSIEHIR